MTDALAHRALHTTLWRRIEREGLDQAYHIDMGVLPFVARMEEVGMACDGDRLRELSLQFEQEFKSTCQQINRLAGKPVNPLSPEQVSLLLFGTQEVTGYNPESEWTIYDMAAGEDVGVDIDAGLGITPTLPTKSRKSFKTGDKYLKARRDQHEIIQLILDARQLNKYRSTYTLKLPGMLRRPDSMYDKLAINYSEGERYYPEWKYTRTATGRLAETIIVLIPKHDPLAKVQRRMNRAKAIRNCFHAVTGNVLVSADLSQIELRVMAHVARDRRFLEAFRRNEDPHAQVAADMLGAPKKKEDQDESAHRLPAKTMNFGIINGMTEFGMLDQLHEAGQLQWTIEQVRDFRDEWFLVHKDVKKFWDAQIKMGRERGYVESMHGRRRYLAGLHSTDERIVRESERQCLFMIQSSADEISKIWNRRIWKRIWHREQRRGKYYCEPWVRVHDDTTLEVSKQIAKETAREMLSLVPQLLSIPTPAEAKSGTEWGDLH